MASPVRPLNWVVVTKDGADASLKAAIERLNKIGYRLYTIRPGSNNSRKFVVIGESFQGSSVEESSWSENLNTPR